MRDRYYASPRGTIAIFEVSSRRCQEGQISMNPLQLPRQFKKALESGILYLLLSIDSFRSNQSQFLEHFIAFR